MKFVDRALLIRAIEGERSAVDSLLHRIRPFIERQLQRYPLNDEDRRDLLQVTMVRVVCRLGSFRGDSNFATWLFRVTANEALMVLRAEKRRRQRVIDGFDVENVDSWCGPPDADGPPHGEASAAQKQRDAWVRNALSGLSSAHRDVVFAHYHLDLGLDEIARRLDLTESAVRSRLHRARMHLRTMLARTPLADDVRGENASADRAA